MKNQNNIIQAYKQAPWRKQVKIASVLLLILVVIALVAGFYLSITAQIAEAGMQVLKMGDERTELVNQIADGEITLANLTSANEMANRARALGFDYASSEEALYLPMPGFQPVDLDYLPIESTNDSDESTVVITESYTQSMWDWFVSNATQADALLGRVK